MTCGTVMSNRTSSWLLTAVLTTMLSACGGYGGGGDDYRGPGGPAGPDGPANPGDGGAKYTVGGTATGVKSAFVLRNNNADDLTVAADGPFVFATALANGATYAVTVQTQPTGQKCDVGDASGPINAKNVTTVSVTCADLPPGPELQVDAGVKSATLTWQAPANAARFNVYFSSAPDCDPRNVAGCADSTLIADIHSPATVDNLQNGQRYLFQLQTVFADGTSVLDPAKAARPNTLAFNGPINAIEVAADGTTYVGGLFSGVGVMSGSGVMLSPKSGRPSADFPVVNGRINASAADGAGGFYFAGQFTRVGDQTRNNVAHMLGNGMLDADFHPDVRGEVFALAVSDDGTAVWLGGDIFEVNDEQRDRLAVVDPHGALLTPNTGTDRRVLALAVTGPAVYVGGMFREIGPPGARVPLNRIAALKKDGTPLPSWDLKLAGDTARQRSGLCRRLVPEPGR